MLNLIKSVNEFKEETVRAIMNIGTISEESASSSQEVLAISEEQLSLTMKSSRWLKDCTRVRI